MDKLIENHNNYLERANLYKKFGYDIEKGFKLIEKIHESEGDEGRF